ncbi:hypothetical protein [Mycoplasmopsis synoviae]|uniref:hypothetical protein n=1 Tax=Mycoplasmopsis synoviae TaxID=2109 RepID=UPI0034DAD759
MAKYLKDLFVAKAKGANYYAVEALKEKAKDLNWKLGKSWKKMTSSWIMNKIRWIYFINRHIGKIKSYRCTS